MSHRTFRGVGALVLTLAVLTPQAGALSNISNWAQTGVAAATSSGLLPSTLEALDAQSDITRAEFCGIIVNTYKAVSGRAVFVSAKKPFRDCDDPNVVAAYELGLVKGRGDAIFDPDASIQRQDLCVMLNNVLTTVGIEAAPIAGESCVEAFPDTADIEEYAVDAMVSMVDHSIINGTSNLGAPAQLAPKGTATREQALIMAERFRQTFEPEDPEISVPDIEIPDASAFPMSEEEKMLLVYGEGGEKYQTAEEAEAHMVEISVPVWRLQKDGSKSPDKAYIQVNQALAPIYEAIFEEIYQGEEQFPIKNVGCYSWRPGEHSQGTAIDINWEENMEATINPDGSLTPTTGLYWLPKEDPYSIAEGGDVYNAFTKYGFAWGGNAWSSKRDYMHFSYFGR